MKRYKAIFGVLAVLLPSASLAGEYWRPEVQFKLEGGSYKETMLWVSGFAYALTSTARENMRLGRRGLYCLPKDGVISGKPLLTILNQRFQGQDISSEQASAALIEGVSEKFKCP